MLECTAAAKANRLILYMPEQLSKLPTDWESAGALDSDLRLTRPPSGQKRKVEPFLHQASPSALIYLELRAAKLMCAGKGGRNVQSSTFELSLRTIRPIIEEQISELTSEDLDNLIELCCLSAEFWSYRDKKNFEYDFCDHLAPVLLSLVGTSHDTAAIAAFNSIVAKFGGDREQYDRAAARVREGCEVREAIHYRNR